MCVIVFVCVYVCVCSSNPVRRLRPELLRQSTTEAPFALPFRTTDGVDAAEIRRCQQIIATLRERLLSEVLVRCAAELEPLDEPLDVHDVLQVRSGRARYCLFQRPTGDGEQIVHRHGINYRYIGKLREHVVRNFAVRQMLLEEMLARTLKDLLEHHWREVRFIIIIIFFSLSLSLSLSVLSFVFTSDRIGVLARSRRLRCEISRRRDSIASRSCSLSIC
jgi:hypothetical protein